MLSQVKPEVLSSACRVDVADSVMDASDTMLEDSGDVKNFLSFVTSAIEDGAGPNGGGDTEALVAAAKAVSHVSQPKSTLSFDANVGRRCSAPPSVFLHGMTFGRSFSIARHGRTITACDAST